MPDLNAMVTKLKQVLILPGQMDDGTNGDRGPIFGTGDTYDYLTYPKSPEVNDGGNGSGTIKYPYDCRERHKHYVAQAETGTSDNNFSGVITAQYDFTFTGKVLISSVNNQGKQGNSGNGIENYIKGLNGTNVG